MRLVRTIVRLVAVMTVISLFTSSVTETLVHRYQQTYKRMK